MGTHRPRRFAKETIEQFAQEILEKQKPETIQDLISGLQDQFEIPRDQSLEVIQAMVAEGKFSVLKPCFQKPSTLREYIMHPRYRWDTLLVLGPTLTIMPIVALSEEFSDIVFLSLFRAILGLVFLLFITGFALTGLLFPFDKDIDEIERVALSVGLSLAIAIIMGLVLNYTWELSLFPILLCLIVLTLGLYALTVFIRIRGVDTFKNNVRKATSWFFSPGRKEDYPQPTSFREYFANNFFRVELLLILCLSLSSVIFVILPFLVDSLEHWKMLLGLLGMGSLLALAILAVQMLVLPWPSHGNGLERAVIGITGGVTVLFMILVLSALLDRVLEGPDLLLFILGLGLLFVYETTLLTIYRRIA